MDNKASVARDEAINFLLNHTTGVLSTMSPQGDPRSRLVYYVNDDAFRIYFITLASTRKATDLEKTPKAAFVVSESDHPRTLQIEGTVEDITNVVGIDPIVTELVRTLESNKKYGPPLGRFDTSTLKYFRITPTWIRWGNFLLGQGTANVLSEIDSRAQEDLG